MAKVSSGRDTSRPTLAIAIGFNSALFSLADAATGLLERPSIPHLTQNATGDSVETDGRLGVLLLEETPTGISEPW